MFKYSTGIEAVKLSNDKGYVTLLPFVVQQIWDMEFLGHNMVMKSIYDEPEVCKDFYGESYGCFLMHCSHTAMGNPTSEDTHTPHGELPIAKYKEAYIIIGEDEKGKYISLSGSYFHKRAFEHNYEFTPECRIYENASTIDMIITFTNHKDLPFGVRWISRTEDEDALGMVLPATAQHMGYLYCKEKGLEKYLESKGSVTYHITTGILSPEESNIIKNRISK